MSAKSTLKGSPRYGFYAIFTIAFFTFWATGFPNFFISLIPDFGPMTSYLYINPRFQFPRLADQELYILRAQFHHRLH